MGGFFIPGFGQGGGGGQPAPNNAFVQARFDAPNTLVLIDGNGNPTNIPLKELASDSDIVSGEVVGKMLQLEKRDGNKIDIDLTRALAANNISFAPIDVGGPNELVAADVQGAIEELNGKVGEAYVDSVYDDDTSELVLIKQDQNESRHKLAHLEHKNFFTENKLQKIDFIRFVMYITNSLTAKRDFKALQ